MKKRILFILFIVLFINGCGSTSEIKCEASEENIEQNEQGKSENLDRLYYDLACRAIDEKKYISALSYLYACNDYLDAENKINELTSVIDESRVGKSCSVSSAGQILAYIDQDSTLKLMGSGKSKYDLNIDEWTDLKSIDVSRDFILGVRNDGTVLMAAIKENIPKVDVSDWTDISDIEIAGISDLLIVGLKNDGTIIYARSEDHDNYMEEHPYLEEVYPEKTETWSNIRKICARNTYGIFGITEEGKIVCTKESLLAKMEDVNVLDVHDFCIAIGRERTEVVGLLGAWPYIPSLDGIIDAVVGHDFVAYLFENGKIVIGNTRTNEVELIGFELDNIVAISLANANESYGNLLAAYGSDGSINLIGNTDSIPKNINLFNTPINVFPVEFIKKIETDEEDKAQQKKEPQLGMTQDEVLESTWGTPEKKNITENIHGIFEQWVYPDYQYLYFDNGILTGIQRSE